MNEPRMPEQRESGLLHYARRELESAGLFSEDSDYGGMLGDAVMKLMEVFAAEGHSGFSASMASSLFNKLSRYEPLSPLTGDQREWNEVGAGMYQNNRCGHVFALGPDGRGAYDLDGTVFREPDGCCYTNHESKTPVTFPYTPTTEYVDVPKQTDDEAHEET